MNDVMLSAHAVARYQERFAGNLGWSAAQTRLRRLLRRARCVGVRPGHARVYALGDMRFVVQDRMLVTVYRTVPAAVQNGEGCWFRNEPAA